MMPATSCEGLWGMSEADRHLMERKAERVGWQFAVPQGSSTDHLPQPIASVKKNRSFVLPLARAAQARAVQIWQSIPDAIETERTYGHVFVFTPVFLGLGAFFWFSLRTDPAPLTMILVLAFTGCLATLLRHRQSLFSYGLAAVALFTAGMLLAAVETRQAATVLLDTPVTTMLKGTVVARDVDERGRWRYLVDVAATSDPALRRPPERVRLLARSKHEPAELGQLIEGRVRLSPPSGPALPGLNDFAFSSYFNGIGAVGYFYGRPTIGDTAGVVSSSILDRSIEPARQWLAALRGAIGAHIRETIGGDAGAIAAALVTAEERAIGDDTIEGLRQAGLAHVLAISGLNMVLAAGTFLIGARTLLCLIPGLAHRVPVKKIGAAGALIMVTFYILISGGAVSAVRSWIMICIMLLAALFDRPSISLRNVALSAIVILIATPSAVTGPGFQMSFAATLALVAGYAAWRERPRHEDQPVKIQVLEKVRPIGQFFAGLLLSSFIGGMSTLIYSVGHFHRIPAYGLIGNLLAMPVISIIVMPFGLLAMLLMPFGLDHYPLVIMGKGLDWVIIIASAVSGWGGEIATGRIDDSVFFLISIGGIVVCLLRTWLAAAGAILIAAGVAALVVPTSVPRPVLVVAEDGELVALVTGERLATNREKPSAFIADQWRRSMRLAGLQPPARRTDAVLHDAAPATEVKSTASARRSRQRKPPVDKALATSTLKKVLSETPKEQFACAPKQWCAATSEQGWRVIAVEDPRFFGSACDSGDIIIVRARIRSTTCRSGAVLITGQSLRRSGALEIRENTPQTGQHATISGQLDIIGAMQNIQRPWTMHRLYDWRSDSFAPDANQTETRRIDTNQDTPSQTDISDSGG